MSATQVQRIGERHVDEAARIQHLEDIISATQGDRAKKCVACHMVFQCSVMTFRACEVCGDAVVCKRCLFHGDVADNVPVCCPRAMCTSALVAVLNEDMSVSAYVR